MFGQGVIYNMFWLNLILRNLTAFFIVEGMTSLSGHKHRWWITLSMTTSHYVTKWYFDKHREEKHYDETWEEWKKRNGQV